MEWVLEGTPAVDSLLEYEARANQVWMRQRKRKNAVICVDDSSRFAADFLVDVMRTHPFTIVDGRVQENPHDVAPDEFIRELRSRPTGASTGGLAPWQLRRVKALLTATGENSISVPRRRKNAGSRLDTSPALSAVRRDFRHTDGSSNEESRWPRSFCAIPPDRWSMLVSRWLRKPKSFHADLHCAHRSQPRFVETHAHLTSRNGTGGICQTAIARAACSSRQSCPWSMRFPDIP